MAAALKASLRALLPARHGVAEQRVRRRTARALLLGPLAVLVSLGGCGTDGSESDANDGPKFDSVGSSSEDDVVTPSIPDPSTPTTSSAERWTYHYTAPNGYEYEFSADVSNIQSDPANPGSVTLRLPDLQVRNLHDDREAPLGTANTSNAARFGVVVLGLDDVWGCDTPMSSAIELSGSSSQCPVTFSYTPTQASIPAGGTFAPQQFEGAAYPEAILDRLDDLNDEDVRIVLTASMLTHGSTNLGRPSEAEVNAADLCYSDITGEGGWQNYLIGYTDVHGEPMDPTAERLVWNDVGCTADRFVPDPDSPYSVVISDDEGGDPIIGRLFGGGDGDNVNVGQTIIITFRSSEPCRLEFSDAVTIDGARVAEVVLDTTDQEVDVVAVEPGYLSLDCKSLNDYEAGVDLPGDEFRLHVVE